LAKEPLKQAIHMLSLLPGVAMPGLKSSKTLGHEVGALRRPRPEAPLNLVEDELAFATAEVDAESRDQFVVSQAPCRCLAYGEAQPIPAVEVCEDIHGYDGFAKRWALTFEVAPVQLPLDPACQLL
jgi:hypothetical protein